MPLITLNHSSSISHKLFLADVSEALTPVLLRLSVVLSPDPDLHFGRIADVLLGKPFALLQGLDCALHVLPFLPCHLQTGWGGSR